MDEEDRMVPEFSGADADFLNALGVQAPFPTVAPWHPIVETLIRCGLAVNPVTLDGKGEVWGVGVRTEARNTFGMIVLPGDPPEMRLAFRVDGSATWRTEADFLGAVAEWLGIPPA